MVKDRHLNNFPQIHYWNELKIVLRNKHVPSYYDRELMDKLQRLKQKSMSVEEYKQKMELLMLRARIREESRLKLLGSKLG